MNDEMWERLESWAEGLYREHDAYWNRTYVEIMKDQMDEAERMGFLPCSRCNYRVAISPVFSHWSLALPGWNGKGEPEAKPCPEHYDLWKECIFGDPNSEDFHNLYLWRDRWNEQIRVIQRSV